jgi:hypothetical protein
MGFCHEPFLTSRGKKIFSGDSKNAQIARVATREKKFAHARKAKHWRRPEGRHQALRSCATCRKAGGLLLSATAEQQPEHENQEQETCGADLLHRSVSSGGVPV